MNIKRFVEIVLLVIYFCFALMAQVPDTRTGIEVESPIKTYIAAKDNWKTIPFVVSNAKKASAKSPIIESLSGAEIVKFDSQTVNKVIGEKIITNDPNAVANQEGQNFEYRFIPREAGDYKITLIGYDASRPNDRDGIGEKEVRLKVVYPFFKDIGVAPPLQAYEGEDLFINFFVNGLENGNEYKIVRTWKEKTDTIPGSIFEMTEEKGNQIAKGDAGQVLKLVVLYQGSIFYYLEGDSASLENAEEGQKINIATLQPKPSIFNIPVVKQAPQVTIPRNDVPYGERIEFTAYYKGAERGEPVQLNEIERPRVINLKNNQNIYQKHEQLSPGKFAIYVKTGLTIPKDGLPIKVIVKVRGQGKEFNQSIKLVKKKK
ncbi:MAG TPA: hypothetical protein VIR55_10550 [Ignavibacteria bacterium]|jgi:hypothetical protein